MIEVLVGLAILGLTAGAALTLVGPWLQQGRTVEREAQLWADLATAQLVIGELSLGVVDPGSILAAGEDEVKFRTYAPRIAPAPFDIRLWVDRTEDDDRLMIESDALKGAPSALTRGGLALRLNLSDADSHLKVLKVEAKSADGWTPVVVAPIPVTAASVCDFDQLSMVCK